MRYLVHQLLESAADARPDGVAVIDGERSMTFAELDARANRVAHLLGDLGVRKGDRVALYIDKSLEAVTAIYGVLKAGAAYVPLDPQAPPVRLAYIARDADCRVLLTAENKQDAWSALVAEGAPLEALVVLDGGGASVPPPSLRLLDAGEVDAAPAVSQDAGAVDSDLAYILYTSGSTGAPKGVMLSHRNCLAFIEWAVEEFAVSADDRVSSHAPLHFDLSTFDLFAAAQAGATLVLVPAAVSIFPAELRRFIAAREITVWYSVPSVLTMLVLRGGLTGNEFPQLRAILFAGEIFPTKHLRRLVQLLPHVRFANLYGPTETNACTWWDVPQLPEDATEAIPIGKAIANVEVFAVTDEGRLAGLGEVGELYVRGATVMQGYLGDPEQTAARLVANPFGGVLDQPVYRTGDLVQELESGDYRLLGRRDSQIKSRGYRIELGEIEAALHAHPSVVECAVVAVPDELVTNRIAAYVTTNEAAAKSELVAFLSERIPQYMIPEVLEFRDELPKTSTGKVDRRELAASAVGNGQAVRQTSRGAPRQPTSPAS